MSCKARPFSVFSSVIPETGASEGLSSRRFPCETPLLIPATAPRTLPGEQHPPQPEQEVSGREAPAERIEPQCQWREKDTAVGGGKVLVQHPVEDVGNVGLEGVPRAGVDVLLRHLPEGHGRALRKRRVKEG